jgi:hypothetical protein
VATMTFVLTACSEDLAVKPIYNHANGRVVVELSDDIDGKALYVRVRRGRFGTLDCGKLRSEIDPIANASGSRIDGPLVDPALTQPFYGPEWGNGDPTPEMIAAAQAGTDSIIDVCLFDGSDLAAHVERDLCQAWDDGRKEGLGGKADDPTSGEVTINSAQEYGVRCVAELGEIARYCVQGGKPAISFDERFMVFHHYVGPNDFADLGFSSASDPAFTDMLAKGTSNIVVVDRVTGARTRVTAMHAGQYALYPHFRSDGWIYFLVRDQNTGREYAVASDAALHM